MSLKPFLYYLVESDGRVRQISNGIVTSLNKKTPLQNSPAGWSDILIKWLRNTDRHGQVRTFSLPLGFVRDGAKILRNDMYRFNIDRELYLLIQRLTNKIDATNYSERYNFFYKGQLDFSTFDDDPGESVVNMNIMEGGISKLVKANENTQYLIPFDEDAINIQHDGVFLQEKDNFIIQTGPTAADHIIGTLFINKDGNAAALAAFTVYTFNNSGGAIDFTTSLDYFFTTAQAITGINVDVSILANYTRFTTGDVNFKIVSNLGQDIPIYTYSGDTGVIQFATTVTLDSVAGEKFFLVCEVPGVNGMDYQETELHINFQSRKSTTFIKAFRPLDVYKKLCIKLGIDVNKVVSTSLAGSTYCLTSGDAIRGLTSGIKTSINDFFKAYNIYLFLGWYIKDITEIEGRDKYYDPVDPVVLGNVADMKIAPATDMIFSSIIFGHAEQQVDDVNGKYDFNGQLIYTTPVKAGGGKKLEMISPYKAGPYEIEIIRINLEGKTTTDAIQDNSVFVIDVALGDGAPITATVSFVTSFNGFFITSAAGLFAGQKIRITTPLNTGEYIIESIGSVLIAQLVILQGGPVVDEATVPATIEIVTGQVYGLDRSVIPTAGVPSPATIYNVRLRPDALLSLHYRWIRSWLYNYEPGILRFEQANRNSDLVVDGLKSGRDIAIASMGAIMFKPYYFNFGTKVPIDLVETLSITPNKSFLPIWEGDSYQGFLIEAGIAPNTRQPQVFKLLCGPETDVTKLIA